MQLIVADFMSICSLTVYALKTARSQFILSLVTHRTSTVKEPYDKKENWKITSKPVCAAVLTTVSVQEFILIHDKIMFKIQHCREKGRY
jgi:hypothetical protein